MSEEPAKGRVLMLDMEPELKSDVPDQACCQEMHNNLRNSDLYLGYNKRTREYFIPYKIDCGGGVYLLTYCPWCGKLLPGSLREKLGDILFDELCLDDFFDDPNMPNEFKTDEWWKKRGL